METGVMLAVYGLGGLFALSCVLWLIVKIGFALLAAVEFVEKRFSEPNADQAPKRHDATESRKVGRRHCPGCNSYHPSSRMGRTSQGLYRCTACRRDATVTQLEAGGNRLPALPGSQIASKPIATTDIIRRVAALNIRHGGGTVSRTDALIARLLSYDADVLVVTEFRDNMAGARLIRELELSGYTTSHPGAQAAQNAILIASRSVIRRSWGFSSKLDSRHLWCAETAGTVICGVYMPQKHEKLPYWEELILRSRRRGIDLCIGDFNTGNNDLDKDPEGARFVGSEMPQRLSAAGYIDVWRSLHPRRREYSWFSPGAYNGFRIDHAYAAPRLANRVVSCEFDQTPRILEESDHAALVLSFR